MLLKEVKSVFFSFSDCILKNLHKSIYHTEYFRNFVFGSNCDYCLYE